MPRPPQWATGPPLGATALLAGHWVGARMVTVSAVIAIVASLVGSTAGTLRTVTTAHTGSIVTAGPAVAGGMGGPGGGMPGGGGGMGGLLNGSKVGAAVTTLLLKNADSYTWVAATIGANKASSYQLATEKSVIPIGGFNGSDPHRRSHSSRPTSQPGRSTTSSTTQG